MELLQRCLDYHSACQLTCVLRLCPAPRHEFPQWRCQDLSKIFPTLEEAGIDLLKVMLEYDPAKRITVSAAAASWCLLLSRSCGLAALPCQCTATFWLAWV